MSMAQGAAAANSCTTPGNVNALASEIAQGVNASRRANGQSALVYNAQLGQAAMAHACDMAVHNFFGHRGSNGTTVQTRVRSAGYRDCLVAENLAWGYPTSQQIISGWMQSAGHRSNMLHPRAREFGIGITQGPRGPNWVLVLAKSC
jgi:uncharacterized protein YkwD